MKRTFPAGLRGVADPAGRRLSRAGCSTCWSRSRPAERRVAARGRADARASTTRPTSSTRFLAQQMGVELVEGRDLVVSDGYVWMRTTQGLRARRRDLPAHRRRLPRPEDVPPRLDAGRARPDGRLPRRPRRAGQRARAPASPTTRSIYAYVPEMIKYYLGEDIDPAERADLSCAGDDDGSRSTCWQNLRRAGGEGGQRVRRLRHAGRPALDDGRSSEEFAGRIEANPRNYIAQPTLALSRVPTIVGRPRSKAGTSTCGPTSSTARTSTCCPAA